MTLITPALAEALAEFNRGVQRARREYERHPVAFDHKPECHCSGCKTMLAWEERRWEA